MTDALLGPDGDGTQLAAADMGAERRQASRRRLCPTRQQVRQLRAGATVGDVGDEHARDQLQVFHRQMPGAGIAG